MVLLVTHSRRLALESKQKPEIHRIVKTWILKSTYTGCKYCCLLLLSFYLHLHFVVLRFVQYFFFRCSVYFSSKPYAHSMTECFKIAHNTYSYKWISSQSFFVQSLDITIKILCPSTMEQYWMYNAYTLESLASSLSQKGYIFRVYGLTKYKIK